MKQKWINLEYQKTRGKILHVMKASYDNNINNNEY